MTQIFSSKYLLIFICSLLIFTRFYGISKIPPSIYWDEASIGYNAYSVALTGKDEWGDFLPIHFRAFGEFKLPVYIYSVVIFVRALGLNEFSIRAPAVLFSLGVVVLTYFLGMKITKSQAAGLLGSFFISISPWYFIFSRTGYEANAGLMFYLLGIYLFLRVRENSWFLTISIVSFILSAYSYNSFRVVTPLSLLVLILINVNELLSNFNKIKVSLILSFIIILLSMIPIYRLYTFDSGNSRFDAVRSFGLHSVIENYFSHFKLSFLLNGDKNLRSQQRGFGQLVLPDFIFIPLGLLFILSKKTKYLILLIALILISPIPAAITKESPHALRTISMVPLISILSSLGVIQLKRFLRTGFVFSLVITIMLIFFSSYMRNFITFYPIDSSQDWQYGYKQIYLKFKNEFNNYERVIISDEYGQPYIFALFYLNYDPEKFQKNAIRNDISEWGFSTVSKFDKFEFGKVDRIIEANNIKNALIFDTKQNKNSKLIPISTIDYLDGNPALWVYSL